MTKTFAEKITDWKTAIEAKIGSMIEEHSNDSTAHSSLFSDKSKVTFTRSLNNGTRIGTLTIDGTSTDIFCETDTNTTYNTATASANGLMSKEDKIKLNNINLDKLQDGATYISVDDDLNMYIGYDPITDILLTSNKSIIQTGQTATLTSTAKNGNTLLEGVPISFYSGNDYLGSAVTNNNGIATFSYVGTGSGNKQITANCGSDVSQPYTVTDCLFLDYATTGKKNTNYNVNSSFQVSDPTDSGTTLTCTSDTSWGQYFHYQNNNTSRPINIGSCIEFDVVAITTCNLQLQGDNLYGYGMSSTGHYKVVVDETHITVYKEGTQIDQKTTSTYITSTFSVKFAYKGIGQYITFANVMIYPI